MREKLLCGGEDVRETKIRNCKVFTLFKNSKNSFHVFFTVTTKAMLGLYGKDRQASLLDVGIFKCELELNPSGCQSYL